MIKELEEILHHEEKELDAIIRQLENKRTKIRFLQDEIMREEENENNRN